MVTTPYGSKPSAALVKRSRTIVDELVKNVEPCPGGFEGRGIVTCGGGYVYFANAWVMIRMLRHLGCELPIQLWYLGPKEVDDRMKRLVRPHGVECIDGLPFLRETLRDGRRLPSIGWVLKSVAVARCPFAEVLFLDADNLPLRDPTFLFEEPPYQATGAVFWPDRGRMASEAVWRVFRLPRRSEPEFESGQLLVNKRVNWDAVWLAEQLNFRADLFYRLMWGDKDTFRFAWHKLGKSFAMPQFPPQALRAAGYQSDMLCQHDFRGARIFQHRTTYKWNLLGANPWIPGCFFEKQCRIFLEELRLLWDGRCGGHAPRLRTASALRLERDLVRTIWLVQVPATLRRKRIPAGFRAPTDRSPMWIELKFEKNGTMRMGSGKGAGLFWEVANSAAGPRLSLSGVAGLGLELRLGRAGWQGRWLRPVAGSKTRMVALEELYPHLKARPKSGNTERSRKIRRDFGNEVHLVHSAAGIGDHVSAAYAATGLARTGVRVVFHSRHARWLARIKEPNLIIASQRRAGTARDLEYDYQHQLRYAASRARWYAGGLHPLLQPARPRVDRQPATRRLPFERYVLLAPCAWNPAREWPEAHWTRLAHMLRETAYEVVAIGHRREAGRLRRMFDHTQAYWVTGHPPEWVMDAMLGAVCHVGVDSGMTHVAALLGINTIAIHSHLKPGFLWPGGTVKSISPDAECVFCRWQEEGGWMSTCQKTCSAIASVSPETVLKAMLECEPPASSKSAG
jgi:hypothetical protein